MSSWVSVELAGLRAFTILLLIATVLISEDQIVTYFVTYYWTNLGLNDSI